MSHQPKRLPSYRLHKASGQAIVTLQGRDYYLGRHGSPESHLEYQRLLKEWSNGTSTKVLVQKCVNPTVDEVLDSYWQHAVVYYAHGSEKSTGQLDRVKRSLAMVRTLYGETDAASFGPLALKAVREEMIKKGWVRHQINCKVGCIKLAFTWAVSEELIPSSVAEGLRTVTGLRTGRTTAPESPGIKPAPEASIAAVKPLLLPMLADVVDLQLLTAARPGEALAIRDTDIDHSGKVWIYRPQTHKTAYRKQERLIFIGPRGQEIISRHLPPPGEPGFLFSARRAVEELYSRVGWKYKAPKGREPRDHYLPTSYSHAIREACKRAGVEPFHPHQLRHNAATRIVAEFGWTLGRIILGHSDLNSTKIYAADDLQRAIEVMSRIG